MASLYKGNEAKWHCLQCSDTVNMTSEMAVGMYKYSREFLLTRTIQTKKTTGRVACICVTDNQTFTLQFQLTRSVLNSS